MAEAPADPPAKVFCNRLRAKKGIDNRDAVLQNNRVSLFRGKDVVRFLRSNPNVPEECGLPTICTDGGKPDEGKIEQLLLKLIGMRYFYRVERKHKKPHPGRTKLVKFPKKLLMVDHPRSFAYDGFYVWNYEIPLDRTTSNLLMVLVVVGVIGCCLFPLAPRPVKLGLLYLATGLCGLFLGVGVLRGVVWLFLWIGLGWDFWIFPYMLDDNVPITQAFKPLYSLDRKGGSLANRAVVALFTAAVIVLLSVNGPSTAQVRDATKQMNKDLLEYLKLNEPKLAITNATNATNATDAAAEEAAANATAANATNATNGTKIPSLDEVLEMTADAEAAEEAAAAAAAAREEL